MAQDPDRHRTEFPRKPLVRNDPADMLELGTGCREICEISRLAAVGQWGDQSPSRPLASQQPRPVQGTCVPGIGSQANQALPLRIFDSLQIDQGGSTFKGCLENAHPVEPS